MIKPFSTPGSDGLVEETGFVGRRACDVYKDGDADSVAFTISSFVFGGMAEGCEVKGFS